MSPRVKGSADWNEVAVDKGCSRLSTSLVADHDRFLHSTSSVEGSQQVQFMRERIVISEVLSLSCKYDLISS